MKLTLKVTERDKKLLVFLAVFILVVGIGIGVILPLLQEGQRLQMEIVDATIEQQDCQRKLTLLPADQSTRRVLGSTVEGARADFFPMLQGSEVDSFFTTKALDQHLVIHDMTIAMPESGEYAAMVPYAQILAGTEQKDIQYVDCYGMYSVQVELTLLGSRRNLQAYVDECAAAEPGIRITELIWQSRSETENNREERLYLKLELNMAEPLDANPFLTNNP